MGKDENPIYSYFYDDSVAEIIKGLTDEEKQRLIKLLYITAMNALDTYYTSMGWFKVDVDHMLMTEHKKFMNGIQKMNKPSKKFKEDFRIQSTDDQFSNDTAIDLGKILSEFGVK